MPQTGRSSRIIAIFPKYIQVKERPTFVRSQASPERHMIENLNIGNVKNLLTLIKPSGRGASLEIGAIVKAQVVNITDKGEAILRLLTTGSDQGSMEGMLMKAFSEVPLTKGQNIFLEVMGGKNNIVMRFLGDSKAAPETMQNIPAKFLDMLAQLSGERLNNSEFQQLLNMLKSLPQDIKNAIPEFKGLEKLLLDMNQIDGKLLKAFVETSGVAFETRLKIAVMNNPGSALQSLLALQSDGDLKALLLKLKNMIKDQNVINTLRAAGYKLSDLSDIVDKFIRNIEFFQLTSKINDMFYTFLPLLWDDLKDGEFLFKKDDGDRGDSYTCDINLDLASLGKLSIAVTVSGKAFYITFLTERPEVRSLIDSQKHVLEERFSSAGLLLKAVNINHKEEITFGNAQRHGINVKI